MNCPRCDAENRDDRRFCAECGGPLPSACPTCAFVNRTGEKFCGGCGVPLAMASRPVAAGRFASPEAYTPRHLADKILTFRAALEGERKQVTVLFCDLAGSTALAERIGADAMHALLNRFFDLALAEVHRYEGTINQFLGDGFMALFGAPLAHEDHARRAVLAALAVQRALRAQRDEDAGRIDVRMGLNTGPVVVGKIGDNLRMDYTAVGETTNLAARLQQLAEPGEIFISETTGLLVDAYVTCDAVGNRRVKGKSEPVAVYRVVDAGPPRRPSIPRESRLVASPLVGRDEEVAVLSGCLEQLAAGRGGIVGVVGEAGLGKSRLIAEVSRRAAGLGVRWLEGRAVSFGRTLSYWPFLEILRALAGIAREDSEAVSQEKLARAVEALAPEEVADILPYLTTLLGLAVPAALERRVKHLDGEAMGRQIFRSTRRLFERLAVAHPVVLVFEDLHWADASSAELIEHLLPLTAFVPLLLCGVGRPEPDGPAARLRVVARASHDERYTEVALAPLSPATSATLLDNLLAGSPVAAGLSDLILARTEGNPFFLEEVVRALITAGTLSWEPIAAEWRVAGDIDQMTIPDSLQGVITARIDRLDDDIKQTLKLASVIGRSFFYRILAAITTAARALDRQLEELQRLELVREKQRVPELEYFFKHALVQEATYESILMERRRQLHREVGECIEGLFANRLEEFYGILAYHYARAEEWARAQDYLFKAGDHAGRVAADTEALAHYQEAVRAYERVFGDRWNPLQRATLERKIGEALFRRGRHAAAADCLLRALRLLGAPLPRTRSGIRLAIGAQALVQAGQRALFHVVRGERTEVPTPAAEEASRVYELLAWIDYFSDQERLVLNALTHLNRAERHGPAVGVAKAAASVGLILDLARLPRLAARYHAWAVAVAQRAGEPSAAGLAHMCRALHDHFRGDWESALFHYRRSRDSYLDAGSLRGAGAATSRIFHIVWQRGDLVTARALMEDTLRVADEAGDRQVRSWAVLMQAMFELVCGPLEAAGQYLEEALALYRAVPSHADVAEVLGYIGEWHLRRGDLERAQTALEESDRIIVGHRVRGHGVGRPRNSLTALYVAQAESRHGPERSATLRRADRASRMAVRQGAADRGFLPGALRLRGSYEWLMGRRDAADRAWRRSLAAAERLNASYEEALTHLEIGRRTGERQSVERAATALAKIGATVDLAAARRLLPS